MKFVNMKSGAEMEVVDSNQIRALLNMSDMGENSKKGQDFGWRLAPEIVVELELMRENPALLAEISKARQIPVENIDDADLLAHYQLKEQMERAQANQTEDREAIAKHEADYKAQVEKLRAAAKAPDTPAKK